MTWGDFFILVGGLVFLAIALLWPYLAYKLVMADMKQFYKEHPFAAAKYNR